MHDNVLRDFSASSGTECIGFVYARYLRLFQMQQPKVTISR